MDSLNKILIFKPMIDKISDGGLFRAMFAWFFRVIAALILLFLLYGSYLMWSAPKAKITFVFFLAMLILQIAFIVLDFIIINILLIRANDIFDIKVNENYPVTPIIKVFIRTIGEILATAYVFLGLGLGIASLIYKGYNFGYLMMFLPSYLKIFAGSGIQLIFSGFIFGFLTLFGSYLISEQIYALVNIAINTNKK